MNHIIPGFLSVAIALSLLSVTAAQSTEATENCGNPSTQREMNECARQAFAAEDRKLNANYREIEKRLANDAEARKRLRVAERAWIAYRDAECAFSASGVTGGSFYPTAIATCMTALTNQRNRDLNAYLHCPEGDLSCPVPAAR